jgi:hypothetical protein
MPITVHSTTKVITLVVDGVDVPARIWEGETSSGIPVHCYILGVGVNRDANGDANVTQFVLDMDEQRAPSAAVMEFPLRLIL